MTVTFDDPDVALATSFSFVSARAPVNVVDDVLTSLHEHHRNKHKFEIEKTLKDGVWAVYAGESATPFKTGTMGAVPTHGQLVKFAEEHDKFIFLYTPDTFEAPEVHKAVSRKHVRLAP